VPPALLHPLRLLRHEAAHAVGALEAHVAAAALAGPHAAFLAAVAGAARGGGGGGVAALRAAHEEFVDAVTARCFLTPHGAPHPHVADLLDAAMDFHALVAEGLAGGADVADAAAALRARVRGAVKKLAAGLRAAASGASGWALRAEDLLARLGPLDFAER
jgi:hypothetical protein